MEYTFPVVIHDSASKHWLHFEHPEQIICTSKPEEILPALQQITALVDQHGWFAVGFISYEAASAFDSALTVQTLDDFPLLWFGLYASTRQTEALDPGVGEYHLDEWLPSIKQEDYNATIDKIKQQIALGNTYQVNYTFRLRNNFSGSSWALFVDMVSAQTPGYSAYLDIGTHIICSASPELFFQLNHNLVTSRPIKGTTRRGTTLADDKAQAKWLQSSTKNRAENVMIVDMIRNDLGRLAEIGSVHVPELFTTERYPTLWQMTSSVTAKTNAPFDEILTALFPCASITGAPKVSTMKIIAELETTPRKIYTGAIGYLAPGRKAQFNVAIRSVLIDTKSGAAEYGIGGGIVWDSTSDDEYAEALLKARVLTRRQPIFSLLETLLWTPQEGFSLLPEHLQRLSDSACYFGFPFDLDLANQTMSLAAKDLKPTPHRFRLLLDKQGKLSFQVFPISNAPGNEQPVQLKIASGPLKSSNIFLYHKTTFREVYESARKNQPACDDVILFNERNEITETTIANLVLELDGTFVTPPVVCGLLPGTFRASLLKQGKISEKIISFEDLKRSSQIFLINSVRGWKKAALLEN